MSKYRPEKIELKCPLHLAEQIGDMLKEDLHDRAKLTRDETDSRAVFSFWPTKSEYFLVTIKLFGMSEQIKRETEAADEK